MDVGFFSTSVFLTARHEFFLVDCSPRSRSRSCSLRQQQHVATHRPQQFDGQHGKMPEGLSGTLNAPTILRSHLSSCLSPRAEPAENAYTVANCHRSRQAHLTELSSSSTNRGLLAVLSLARASLKKRHMLRKHLFEKGCACIW